jgi:hypothetical protein
MVKLSEQAQQTVDRTKARFLVVQPDGTIKRRGLWAFNIEVKARYEVAGQNGVKVYDRQTGEFLTDAGPSTDAAVIPAVEVVEPVITAPAAQASGDQPIGNGDRLPGDVLTAAEHSKAFPGGEPIVPETDEDRTTELSSVFDQLGIPKPSDEPLEPAPSPTPVLDSMIEVLSNGKPRGQRKTRSKKDGKPKSVKVDRGANTIAVHAASLERLPTPTRRCPLTKRKTKMIALLHTAGPLLYGPRWQSEIGRALGVSDRSVRLWIAKDSAPDEIKPKVKRLIKQRIRDLERVRASLDA